LKNYKKAFDHPFLLRRPLELPAGTVVRGVPGDARVALLPWKPSAGQKPGGKAEAMPHTGSAQLEK
jgi:hypothetical protein